MAGQAGRPPSIVNWLQRHAQGAASVQLEYRGADGAECIWSAPWHSDFTALGNDLQSEMRDHATEEDCTCLFYVKVLNAEERCIASTPKRVKPDPMERENNLGSELVGPEVKEDGTPSGYMRQWLRHVENRERYFMLAVDAQRNAYKDVIDLQRQTLKDLASDNRELVLLLTKKARKDHGIPEDADDESEGMVDRFVERAGELLPAVMEGLRVVQAAKHQSNGHGHAADGGGEPS